MVNKAASELAKLRKTNTKSCEVCGRLFTAIARAKVCSNACRLKKSREKRKRDKLVTPDFTK